jgi:hypothetical protein
MSAMGIAGTARRTLAAITRVTMKISDVKRRAPTPNRRSRSAYAVVISPWK